MCEKFEATPTIHLATPISRSLEAFLCFCRGAAKIINRALIAASRDKKPDYEVRGDPTCPRCALHSTILLV